MADLIFNAPNNVTTITGWMDYLNYLTDTGQGGMFWTVILVVFGSILFLLIKAYSTEKAFGVTSIIVCVTALLFKLIGLISNTVFTITIIIMLYGVVLLVKEAAPYEQ